MTSAHSMQTNSRLRLRPLSRAPAAALALLLCGCAQQEKLEPPHMLLSPYPQPPTQLWAVVPFVNESGVSIVKPDRIADLFVEQAEGIDGVATVPVNRVLLAMKRLQMRSVATPGDAGSLMNVLGVDGLIVGTVTAYDPYPPLKFGAAVQLYHRDSRNQAPSVDPVHFSRATRETVSPAAMGTNGPVAQASGIFEASNHQTLMWLDEFATGRTEPGSAYGQRAYLVNMELYTQFAAYRLLHDLLASERSRLMPAATQPANAD